MVSHGAGQGQGGGTAQPHCASGSQKEVAKMYSSYQVTYTVGYSLSLAALLLALVILLGFRYIAATHTNTQCGKGSRGIGQGWC